MAGRGAALLARLREKEAATARAREAAEEEERRRRTPTMEQRRAPTPTMEQRRRTPTPTMEQRKMPTPTMEQRRTPTPTMDQRRAPTPAMEQRRTPTPTMEQRRRTPTPTIERTTSTEPETTTARTPTTETASSSEPGAVAAGGRGRGRAALVAKMRTLNLIPEAPRVMIGEIETPSPSPPPPRPSTSLSSDAGPVIKRGTAGKAIPCTANYLQLEVRPGGGVFEYEVKFQPQVDSINEKRRCLDQHKEMLGNARNFDGTKLHLPRRLSEEPTVFISTLSSTGEQVKLGIFFKKQKRFSDSECIYIYNSLFKRVMYKLKLCNMRRSYYDPTGAISVEQHKLEIWPGYITAIDEYEGGLHLLCETSHRVLRTETALDVLRLLVQGGVADVQTAAEKALLGAVVLTRYNNKIYRVDDVDFNHSPRATFTTSNGETISYLEYYRRQYDITIEDDEQPLLIHRPKVLSAHESEVEKLIMLVPELCNMTGLTDAMRDNFYVMRDIGSLTRLTPKQRQEALAKFVHRVHNTPEAREVLEAWGLRIATSTVRLEGRILPSEQLHFGKGYKEVVQPNADWGRTSMSKSVLTAINFENWVIVFPEKLKTVAETFYKELQQQGPRLGINIAIPDGKKIPNDRTESYLKAIKDSVGPDTQFVVTIFPQQRSDRYAAIKKMCYVDTPVASQVVLAKTLQNDKKRTAVLQKIALQINCKLGGELWASQCAIKNIMVIGIDTFHDPDRKGCSIAGFISSMNGSFSRWLSTTCRQRVNQELVDALKVAFTKALKTYHHHHRMFPATIIVFRDGVGDGQLDTVAKHEVPQLKDCFKQCSEDYHPKFAFVVVQKRINTRIYSTPRPGEHDNPPPGTVIDHHITRRDWYDFFLVSQKVGQGTVSPTHFVVVCDDCGLPPDVVQKLSYKLTHMYYNWPGTVRVPAPCQYAHKLAAMVGEHLHKEPSATLEDKLFYL